MKQQYLYKHFRQLCDKIMLQAHFDMISFISIEYNIFYINIIIFKNFYIKYNILIKYTIYPILK